MSALAPMEHALMLKATATVASAENVSGASRGWRSIVGPLAEKPTQKEGSTERAGTSSVCQLAHKKLEKLQNLAPGEGVSPHVGGRAANLANGRPLAAMSWSLSR